MADKGTKDTVFPFENLSPELRNNTYELLTVGEKHVQLVSKTPSTINDDLHTDPINAVVTNGPVAKVLSTNRQIKQEYEGKAQEVMGLVLWQGECFNFTEPVLPGSLSKIRRIDVEINVQCCPPYKRRHPTGERCDAGNDAKMHREWISSMLARLPEVQEVRVRVHVHLGVKLVAAQQLGEHCSELMGELRAFAGLAKVKIVEIGRFRRARDPAAFITREKDLVVITWTKEAGWVAGEQS